MHRKGDVCADINGNDVKAQFTKKIIILWSFTQTFDISNLYDCLSTLENQDKLKNIFPQKNESLTGLEQHTSTVNDIQICCFNLNM